jgi:hypothetical protein
MSFAVNHCLLRSGWIEGMTELMDKHLVTRVESTTQAPMTLLSWQGPTWPILNWWSSGLHLWPGLFNNFGYLCSLPQFFLCLNLKLKSVPRDGLRGLFCLPLACLHSSFFLCSSSLLVSKWWIGWPWHMEPQELGLWPRTLVTDTMLLKIKWCTDLSKQNKN